MKKMILVVVLALFGIAFANAQDQVVVYGTIKNTKRDTIKIVLTENTVIRQSRTFYVKLENGSFRQTIPLKQHSYIYVNENTNYVNGFIKPGDDIRIEYDANDPQNSLALSGTAKEKFEWANELTKAKLHMLLREQAKMAKEKQHPYDYLFEKIDSTGAYFISRLKQIKDLDPVSAHLLEAHIEGTIHSNKYFGTTYIFSEDIPTVLAKRQDLLTPASRNTIGQFLKFKEENYNSPLYVNSIYNVLFVHHNALTYSKQMSEDISLKYRYIDSLLPGKLKVPVMTLFLESDLSKTNQAEDLQKMIDFVFAYPAEPIYKEFIDREIARTTLFKKGMAAPAFTLENEKGEKINLASFKGKVVYMDFWFGACAPCHSLFTQIKPVKEHYKQNKDVVFLTISVDDRFKWKDALKKFKIPGYHAYTEDKERAHAVINDYKVQEYPTTFLIDKNGNIFLARPASDPNELKNQIAEALK
jgi:cytochrome oxidase Cu insertion factor (SCO1/SenC/PrrC family)